MRRIKPATKKKIFTALVVVALLVTAGFIIRGSHAATGTVTAEAENGGLAAGAVAVSDTTASGGKAAQFKAAATASGGTVDSGTLVNKYLLGYQGWFRCPGDGSGTSSFNHWMVGGKIDVDQWPDTSELATADKCDTGLKLPNGTPAYVYSDFNQNVEDLHFKWLQNYGVDGVMLQRFVTALPETAIKGSHNYVATEIMNSATKYGRTFNIMYDTTGFANGGATRSGCSSKLVCAIEDDWKNQINDQLKLTASSRYQKQAGRPVVVVWGYGFGGRPGTPADIPELVNWFHNNPNGAQYNATVMCGVNAEWQTSAYATAFKSCDIASRWSVGDGKLADAADQTYFANWAKQKTYADAVYAKQNNMLYMPVVWPGLTDYNRQIAEGGKAPADATFNPWPRWGGNQIWQEAYNNLLQMKAAGQPLMLFGAMYDEANEGTSRIKFATGPAMAPNGAKQLYTNMDGFSQLPSDWQLQVDRQIAKMMRGEIPMTSTMPSSITPH